MLPVNSGGHTAYQDFLLENLRKYYPNPDSIALSTWDIIERFWNLDLSFTDEFMKSKYSVFAPKPSIPFIYSNRKRGSNLIYKNDFTSVKDSVLI